MEKKLGKKTIFSTADWAVEQPTPVKQDNTYDVVYIGLHPRNKKLRVSGDRKRVDFIDGGGSDINGSLRIMSGDATFSADGRKISGQGVFKARLGWNDDPNNKGVAIEGVVINGVKLTRSSTSRTGDKSYPITVANPGSLGRGPTAKVKSVSSKKIKFTDAAYQMDTDAEFKILSTDPGVTAKFTGSNDDNLKLVVRGNGNVNLQLEWDDDPRSNGESVGNIKVAGETFKQTAFKDKKGDVKKTITVRSNSVNQLSKRGDDTKNINLGAKPASSTFRGLSGGTKKQGVTYSGPELFRHTNKAWSKYMNKKSVSPFIPPLDVPNQKLVGTKVFTWSNVNFFENGRYEIKLQSDGNSRLFINGQYIMNSTDFSSGSVISQFVNLSAGKYEVKVEALDDSGAGIIFNQNPRGFALEIKKEIIATVPAQKSWRDNPVGISAILIPPPCPLETKGLGKLCDIFPLNPGNGYSAPPGPGYPVVLEVIRLEPINPGINYGPDDPVCIIKEDGSKVCFAPNLGPFGANLPIDIDILTPPGGGSGVPITSYPNIFQSSPTGVNSRFRPVIRVRRDPLDVEPEDILQVTDLVGLKRTGYVGGREYFGAVFYKDGVRYAGYYETPGQLIQVYDTLQESIDGEVTTRPSAILRQGTDITSNDPRLNIPGTPENLT